MASKPRIGGHAGNIAKNSITSLLSNVLPSMLRFFSRYIFIKVFGDTLLGVNSLFSNVITVFSFAEIGIYSAVLYFLYKPIADGDVEKIQSFLGLFRNIMKFLIAGVILVGLAFIPFLDLIKSDNPIPGLLVYYLIFLLQNVISYLFAYRIVFLLASEKSYELAPINLAIAFATEVLQIIVTVTTRSFVAYLLTYVAMLAMRILLSNRLIVKRYPITRFKKVKKLDKPTIKLFVSKVKSLFLLKVTELGVSQTDSMIVSTMVDVKQWGFVSNYMAISNMTSLLLSSLASGLVPSLGNMSVTKTKEEQEDSFKLYYFCNTLLAINLFACLVILVPPFIRLVLDAEHMLDDLTCFLIFINVLYSALLEPVAVLRDALGLYEKDKWINITSFFTNLIASILFIKLIGLPGVFLGTICSTTITYYRIYNVLHHAYGGNCASYYFKAIKTLLTGTAAYAVLHWLVYPAIWRAMSNFIGLVITGIATLVITNLIFAAVNFRDPYFSRTLQLIKRFVPKRLLR